MKNSLKIVAVLVGTFVGAGFASGQEIMQYFVVFGNKGLIGAFVSCLIFSVFCYCTMNNLIELGDTSYLTEVNRYPILKFIYCSFMVTMFCTMVTATGEMLHSVLELPKIYGVIGMAAVSGIVLWFGGKGIVRLNTMVTPLILVGILVVFFMDIYTNSVSAMACGNYFTSSIIYVSYNMITLSAVISGISKFVNCKKTAVLSSATSGLVIYLLIACMWYILHKMPVNNHEIPVLQAMSSGAVYIYVPVLIAAMVTTAVSNGYGLICERRNNRILHIIALCFAAIIFSVFRFSFIVKYFYGVFGFVGIFVMADNFRIFVKMRKTKKKEENK